MCTWGPSIENLPVCLIRGLFRKRSLAQPLEEAWQFAICRDSGLVLLAVALIFAVGIPFGILNLIGIISTGHEYCWWINCSGPCFAIRLGRSLASASVTTYLSAQRRTSASSILRAC